MRIKTITLYNYRLYLGTNTISFNEVDGKNIFLISGQNGFGKTTFLHSLLWCLYGRLMTDVDESVRKDIANKGGYNSFLKSNLNSIAKANLSMYPAELLTRIKRKGYTTENEKVKNDSICSITIEFADIFIPSIPCKSLKITRSYDSILDKESTEIFIDGAPNELSKDIGSEVFINDFILNKDIARFFFFDSERIVALADTNTIEEKRKLNSAYNEVLGVKKYEDLKKNLENLRLRFRRKSDDIENREKLISLIEHLEELKEKLVALEVELTELEEQNTIATAKNEELQIQLLREGNNMTMEELKRLESIVKTTREKDLEYKNQLKAYLEYAPFAICGGLLKAAKDQVEQDFQVGQSKVNAQNQNALLLNISNDLSTAIDSLTEGNLWAVQLKKQIDSILGKYVQTEVSGKQLLNISDADYKEFMSVYVNVTSTYKSEFARLAEDYKKNKQILERSARKISSMQTNESDSLIKSIRVQKNAVEKEIAEINDKIRKNVEDKAVTSKDIATVQKKITALSKIVSLDDSDLKKDELAGSLIAELETFLTNLKKEKKASLEYRIKNCLNSLMHKENFIGSVKVSIEDEAMDITLISSTGDIIRKDSLSKGEQQLYATSLLKALVDESGIDFPVFIDSPLQKFDKSHSNKIITEFYPSISKQVVLFPLLHKELTEPELEIMKPMVNSTYLIVNEESRSFFKKIETNALMEY